MTTPPKMRRVAENDYEIGEAPMRRPGCCCRAVKEVNLNAPCYRRDATDRKLAPPEGVRVGVQRSAG